MKCDNTYRVSCVTNQASSVLNDVRVRLAVDEVLASSCNLIFGFCHILYPQTPRTDFFANSEMVLDLLVQFRIRSQQLLHWTIFSSPALIYVVSCLTREEAVVGEEVPSIAWTENDLVPFSFLAAPVFKRGVTGVVSQA